MSAYRVISVVGPTASGKSSLADALCLRLGGEVVSADSMQVYRGMDIGTAKTPVAERRVPLHCIDLVDIGQPYSAAVFAQDSHACIDGLLEREVLPVVCGGTGLYVRAALEDMGFPEGEQVENPVRERYEALAAQMGNDAFHELLQSKDPCSAALIHPNNVRRVVRAFELLEQGSSYAQEHATLHERIDRYPTLHVGLTMPREMLYERINRRGETSMDEAVEDIKRSSRRYAKRQYTWFNADKRIHWFDASQMGEDELVDRVVGLFSEPGAQQAL